MCEDHPHAGTLPNSSKHYMRLDIDGRPAGLAVWGYGIVPHQTPKHLFGDTAGVHDYLELCRFFVYDWCPTNTASRFLAVTHRVIKRHAPHVKWLYTYAAGFQGLVGHIYKAAGYTYIGRTLCNGFAYVPRVGLIHAIAIWHRWKAIKRANNSDLRKLRLIFPDVWRWCGYNFRYIYWLCSKAEKTRLLSVARFEIQPYPTEADLEIWLEDENGRKEAIEPAFAKTIPIVKLPTRRKRATSIDSDATANQAGDGGASPTVALSNA